MAKGGASEAATEPPPKQARTPTRRKLDMLAANDAGAREEDAATGETGFQDADASLPGVKHVSRDRLPVETEKRNARARDSEPEETASKTPGSVSARASRERVWSLLLGNVVRAVDEVYFLCEMECGAPEIEGTASLLEACAADFKALRNRIGDQEKFLAARRDGEGNEKRETGTSISWDVGRVAVRPSDASRDMIRAVVAPPR